jgi:hypothetical protein
LSAVDQSVGEVGSQFQNLCEEADLVLPTLIF